MVVVAQGIEGKIGHHSFSTFDEGDRVADKSAVTGVTVTSGNGPLTAADETAVLGTLGGSTDLTDLESIQLVVRPGHQSGRFVVYRASALDRGTFTVRACGAPYNDGASVDKIKGTFRALEEPGRTRVVRCDADATDKPAQSAQDLGCGS